MNDDINNTIKEYNKACQFIPTSARVKDFIADPEPVELYIQIGQLKDDKDQLQIGKVALMEHVAYLESALREIAKGTGAFSRDPLIHAGNCIEYMKEVAKAALDGTWKKEDD